MTQDRIFVQDRSGLEKNIKKLSDEIWPFLQTYWVHLSEIRYADPIDIIAWACGWIFLYIFSLWRYEATNLELWN